MDFAFPPTEPTVLPVSGTDTVFPVRRVYCVGRNYAAHAVEMGHDPDREAPFFFQKNPDDLVPGGGEIAYPALTDDLHHEVELVVALEAGGSDIPVDAALEHVYGYAVGIDLTRRDRQGEAKKAGRPWTVGKSFDRSGPVSSLATAARIGHPDQGAIWLDVDGERRQTGDLDQMIWKTAEIIAELSRFFTLAPGDIIMTGTPSGVAAVGRGQSMACGIDGVGTLDVAIV